MPHQRGFGGRPHPPQLAAQIDRRPLPASGKNMGLRTVYRRHSHGGRRSPARLPAALRKRRAALDRQHHEDFEAQVRETERQRQEIERLHAELDAK